MAIVIPSKSLYSPIENEKVRTPINSVFVTEVYTNTENRNFSKTISAYNGKIENEKDVLIPFSEYRNSTLKIAKKYSMIAEYHFGEIEYDDEGNLVTDGIKYFYRAIMNDVELNKEVHSYHLIDKGGKTYAIELFLEFLESEDGIAYILSCSAENFGTNHDEDDPIIQLDGIQLSLTASAVKIDGGEVEKKYGESNYNNFSLQSNELLQSSATVDRGLSGIRYYGIERANPIDYDINEGYRYEYKVVQGNDISSLSPVTDEAKRYVGWYHSDGKTVVNVYNLSENTEINKHNADFIRNVGFYWGIDNDEIPCTYSFMEDLLSVYIDEEINLSLGFRVVLDFGEGGWRKTENLSSVIAKGVLEQYGKGKETARIRCSTNDYYDENGELAISPTGKNELPMLFSINDEVIPMVTTERAMSYYKDETPKVFRVVGVRFENRGTLWQELTLQEK